MSPVQVMDDMELVEQPSDRDAQCNCHRKQVCPLLQVQPSDPSSRSTPPPGPSFRSTPPGQPPPTPPTPPGPTFRSTPPGQPPPPGPTFRSTPPGQPTPPSPTFRSSPPAPLFLHICIAVFVGLVLSTKIFSIGSFLKKI